MTKQKKPKVGDTVGWAVVNDRSKVVLSFMPGSRSFARLESKVLNAIGKHGACRVARIVLDK